MQTEYGRGYYEGRKNYDCRFLKNPYYMKGWFAGQKASGYAKGNMGPPTNVEKENRRG
jgi:hypothetical protein